MNGAEYSAHDSAPVGAQGMGLMQSMSPDERRCRHREESAAVGLESSGPGGEGRAGQAPAQKKGPIIELAAGDLLEQKVEAIVNAWNRNAIPYWLLVTQGVSGAIKRAGGIGPFKELRAFGILPLGAARVTGAGNLPFRGIIHVAGINHAWRSSEYSVRESVKNALNVAGNYGFESVAFPAIGAGSSVRLPGGKEISFWGLSTDQSLALIEEEARRSSYNGRVVIVKFKKRRDPACSVGPA